MSTFDPFLLARRTDPHTSHVAALLAAPVVKHHQAAIVAALKQGPAGASEIAYRANIAPHQVGKRLSELQRAGLIVETGEVVRSHSGRPEREWKLGAHQ